MKLPTTSALARLLGPMGVALALSLAGAALAAPPGPPSSTSKTTRTSKARKKPAVPGKASPPPTAAADKAAAEPAGPATPPADATAIAELKKSNATLKRLLQKQAPAWSPEAEARRAEVRKVVGSFLDYEELARRALARHWEGLTAKQRSDFVDTLRELVERNYVKQIHGQPDYDLKLEKETRTGNEALVTGTLHATTAKGKKLSLALEYKVIWKTGRWLVYDVVTDEQSLLENYRAEFNKIITKDGFEALLKRMKSKLAEKE